MINFRRLLLFNLLLLGKNAGAFDSKKLSTDFTDAILSWPELETERLINLDAMVTQPKIKTKVSVLKRERDESAVGTAQKFNSRDVVPLNFELSKRLRQELYDANSGKCMLCSQVLYSQTFSVLSHYQFGKMVLGLKSSSVKHFDRLEKVCAKPEYADIVAHFARRFNKEMLDKKCRQLKK